MTLVRTDLGNTRESARRIRYEPGGTIIARDVQEAIEESVADAIVPAATVMAVTGAIPVTAVAVQTNPAAPITVTVPSSASWLAQNGRFGVPLSIFDIAGNAATHNVTIDFTGGETASGMATLTIADDYGGWRLAPKSGGGWVIV